VDGLVGDLGGWGNLTAAALVSIFVMLVFTGRVVTRNVHQDVIKEKEAWHTAHTVSEEGRRMLADQLQELLEVGRTQAAVVHALPLPQYPVLPNDTRSTS
jgi:hypothetical protein